MMTFEVVMAIGFPLGAVEWARRLRPAGVVDALCAAWIALIGSITLTAFVLSSLHRLGSPAAWALGGVLCALAPVCTGLRRTPLAPMVSRTGRAARAEVGHSAILKLMLLTVSGLGLANLVVIMKTAPGSADVLAYHLPKMAFAVQSGSFTLPYANYWAQQVHPHDGTALLVYAFIASGGNEHWLPLWQYASYWIAIACVAGLAREAGAGMTGALFAGCVFGLLTNALMQATDAGNDLLLAGHAGVSALMIVRAVRGRCAAGLPIAGLSMGAAVGTKALFLIAIPPLAWLFVSVWREQAVRPRLAAAILMASLGFAAMALPSGYLENARRWSDPFLGPPEVRRETTFAGRPIEDRLVNGTRNVARFVVDSLSADGLPRLPVVISVHRTLRAPLRWVTRAMGMDLESPAGTRAAFAYDRLLSAHESHAFWGILGVLLIWPALIVGVARGHGLLRALAVGGALIFPLQAYTALYDPWHGRYFLLGAILLAPVAGWMSEWGPWRRYARAAALVGCASAMSAVLFRSENPLVGTHVGGLDRPSMLGRDRVEQLTRTNRNMESPVRAYERLVPTGAIVQVTVEGGTGEYWFFGEHLSRRLHPRPPGSPVPASHWLLLQETVEPVAAGDVSLGAGFWLRKPVSDSATTATARPSPR